LLAASVVAALAQPQAALLIRAVDESRHPVRLTRADVYFDVWGGECGGACCGPLGTTDAAGNLTVTNFYPEEYDRVLIPVAENEFKSIWEIDSRRIAEPRKRLVVTLE
jgi:hypothetical protein